MKRATKTNISKVKQIAGQHHFIKDRAKALKAKGFDVITAYMGSGGKYQTKSTKDKVRVQIGYGKGRYNKATVVELKK